MARRDFVAAEAAQKLRLERITAAAAAQRRAGSLLLSKLAAKPANSAFAKLALKSKQNAKADGNAVGEEARGTGMTRIIADLDVAQRNVAGWGLDAVIDYEGKKHK